MAAYNLPRYTTPFISRETEIAEIVVRLKDPNCHLLTLVGPGGIGKTRLAVEAISELSDLCPDGIYFVPLQSTVSIESIVPLITSLIEFDFRPSSNPKSQLFDHLREKRLLLILDNLEHLLTSRTLIAELLTAVPQLKLIGTSHEALNIRDEWLYQVDGLSYPDHELAKAIDAYGAIDLFVHHAVRMRRDFSLETNLSAVIEICQMVQGIPLAVELAATWLRRLPCAEIASELQQSLDILQTNMHGLPDRHRSMRAVFDYSWKLLNVTERKVLMYLSIFRSGFRPEAAEQIADASLTVLMGLVDKSILRVNDDGRYIIHELQRQYAEQRLEATPEQKDEIYDRHSAYYLAFMDRPPNAFLEENCVATIKAIDAEIDNVRMAWYWAVARKDASHLHMAATGLRRYTWGRQWLEEGQEAFRQAVAALRDEEPTHINQVTLGHLLSSQAIMDLWNPQTASRAREHAQESVNILRPLDAKRELTIAVGALGNAAIFESDWENAKLLWQEAIALCVETGNHELRSRAYQQLSFIAEADRDFAAFEHWTLQALHLSQEMGYKWMIAIEHNYLGILAHLRGQIRAARHHLLESVAIAEFSVAIAEFSGPGDLVANPLRTLGDVALEQGQLDEAEHYCRESLQVAMDNNSTWQIIWCLAILADVLTAQGDQETAYRHYEEALRLNTRKIVRWGYARALDGMGALAWHQGDLETAWQYYHESLQLQQQQNNHFTVMRTLTALGRIAVVRGHTKQAVNYFLDALQEAIPPGFIPSILDTLIAVADMFLEQGKWDDALRLATLVRDHPVAPAVAKTRAEKILTKPEAKSHSVTQDRTAEPDVLQIASDLVEEFSAFVNASAQANLSLTDPLTPRELEVLKLLSEGLTNPQIAERLFVTVGAIKRYTSNIYGKLSVENRIQAVAQAHEIGLV